MHLKVKTNKDLLDNSSCKSLKNMASSLLNDDEDNATRNTQQQQQQQNANNNNNISNSNPQNNNNLTDTSSSNSNKMQENEAKLKKQNLEQRKLELEKLLNEKSWLLQQLQKQETQILQGNFEYMNFNDFIQNLAQQYKQENTKNTTETKNSTATSDGGCSIGGTSISAASLTPVEESILRRKPLTAKENHLNNNVLHRRQSEISNRSSEYDNYPQHDNHSMHSEGGRGGGAIMQGAAQATQQYATKAALKKRSATVAGTTTQSSTNLQMIRQQHLEQQQQQQLLYKQQQQQHHLYHHPQQHLFKPHLEHHQVLMPHLQYATQKFYYTTLQPQPQTTNSQQQQQQQQYGRYIQNKQIAQQQTQTSNQQQQRYINSQQQLSSQQQQQQHQQLLLTPPSHSSSSGQIITMDNISLYSLNSNNVATLHRPAQQQQPIIVQCDKYYLSPTSHHVSQNDGAGFIKSSQNIKEYISPMNSPQHLMVRDKSRIQTSQMNLAQRATPSLDAISLAPSYVSMETIDYATSPAAAANMRWRSQSNLPPIQNITPTPDMKSQSQDMLNNNQYYNTTLNPPPATAASSSSLAQGLPPNVTQVKPFKPLDDISINSFSSDTQKKLKPKQWLESSLDGPVIRQTTPQNEEIIPSPSFQRTKLSSQSLNTSRHYSMSAAQSKAVHSNPSNVASNTKLSQSTSYLNQIDANLLQIPINTTSSISQAYNLELSPQTPTAYKYLSSSPSTSSSFSNAHQQQQKPPARPPPSALYINTSNSTNTLSSTPTTPVTAAGVAALSPDIRIESPVNMTVVQPATFQPYKEVTKPFEMSDFYKYSTKFRQKENNSNNNNPEN